jgi:hypothetical protein
MAGAVDQLGDLVPVTTKAQLEQLERWMIGPEPIGGGSRESPSALERDAIALNLEEQPPSFLRDSDRSVGPVVRPRVVGGVLHREGSTAAGGDGSLSPRLVALTRDSAYFEICSVRSGWSFPLIITTTPIPSSRSASIIEAWPTMDPPWPTCILPSMSVMWSP